MAVSLPTGLRWLSNGLNALLSNGFSDYYNNIAPDYESGGQGFDSLRAHHFFSIFTGGYGAAAKLLNSPEMIGLLTGLLSLRCVYRCFHPVDSLGGLQSKCGYLADRKLYE